MSKHTPGPWKWWPDCCRVGGMVTAETGQHIAAPAHLGHDVDMTGANARLIAAAPNLYEALKEAERIFRKPPTLSSAKEEIRALNRMRAAMRTAEGRAT